MESPSESGDARPKLPTRSASRLVGGPPADASKPDIDAVIDVYKTVDQTGSLEAAAQKLQQYAQIRAMEEDPEESEYLKNLSEEDHTDEENGNQADVEEVVHLQEVIEGLWIGDLVSAMDITGLEERGIVSFGY